MAAATDRTMDFKSVKDRDENRCDAILEGALGAPVKRGKRWVEWRCPWHHDPVPSLKVDLLNNRWKCFGGCHGGEFHDVFDFMELFYGLDRTEAFYQLSGERPDRKLLATVDLSALPPAPKEKEKRIITLDEVKSYTGSRTAQAYFNGRGITLETIQEYFLGDQNKPHPIVTDDPDNPIGWTTRHHYTIPHFKPDGTIAAVKCRRDDDFALKALASLPDEVFIPALEFLHDKYGGAVNVTEKVMLDHFFGGKFSHWSGGSGETMYNERILHKVLPNGDEIWPWLPYILITEAEIDVLYLRDAKGLWGYPAVAVKKVQSLNLEWMFRHVGRIYIIQDNDPDKQNRVTGEISNAGENIARDLVSAVPRARIINPPSIIGGRPINDVNNMPVKELVSWLTSSGILPQPRSLL